MTATAHRLPTQVRPKGYDVELSTHPDRSDFAGRVRMELDVRSAAEFIEMHARDLVLADATIDDKPAAIELDASRQIVRFRPEAPISAGSARLEVHFTGRPSPSMHGLYLASDGASRAICTQCEATDARAIFPCFDEPEFKASIRWTIRTRSEDVALANGPLGHAEVHGGEKVWHFEATRPVSSYLAALAVGDFEGSEAKVVADIPLRVWATRGKLGQTGFALGYTSRLLPWYETYFDIRYPFAKYDQVAVPGFDAGAMENIGLVLFRQNLLLMDPGTASWRQEKLIAKVIAHEFAHMWFGNLVTMKWWDDLWLNEAFAEWMAHKACDAQSPEYRVWDDFQDDKNRALVDDALPTTHPIWAPVDTPDQAIEMFDSITYQKGCSVMRMLENFLGEVPFRDGLRRYMKAFAGGNAAGPDLWRALEEASNQPVGTMMGSWISVPGFPVLAAELKGDQLELSQRRFFSSAEQTRRPDDQIWSIPVVVKFADDAGIHTHRFILESREQTERLPATGRIRWVYPNAEEIGFYRCRLEPELDGALRDHGLSELTPIEQSGYIEDQWALVRNCTSTMERFLDVLEACATRGPIGDHNVLRAVVDRLGTIERLIEDSGDARAEAAFRAWVIQLLASPLAKLGYEPRSGESQNDLQRRALLIHGTAKIARFQEAVEACVHYADLERENPRAVDPNLAGTFLGIAATVGDASRYATWVDTYLRRRQEGAPPQLTLRYLYTLSAFRVEALGERTLKLVDDETIPQEAVGPVLSQLLAERHSQLLAWDYLRANWPGLKKRVGDMGISRVVDALGALKSEHRAAIVTFFEINAPAGAERALARALENLDQREELRQRVTPALLARFSR